MNVDGYASANNKEFFDIVNLISPAPDRVMPNQSTMTPRAIKDRLVSRIASAYIVPGPEENMSNNSVNDGENNFSKLDGLVSWVFISLMETIKHQFVRSLANEAQNRFAFDKLR